MGENDVVVLSLLIGCGTTDPPTAEPSERSQSASTIEDISWRGRHLPKLLPFRAACSE